MKFPRLFKRSNEDESLLIGAKQVFLDTGPFPKECISELSGSFPNIHPYKIFRSLRLAVRQLFGDTWLGSQFVNDDATLPDLAQFGSPASELGKQFQELELARLNVEFAKLNIQISVQSLASMSDRRSAIMELILSGNEPSEEMIAQATREGSELFTLLTEARANRLEIYSHFDARTD
jgi:hypothetical protein